MVLAVVSHSPSQTGGLPATGVSRAGDRGVASGLAMAVSHCGEAALVGSVGAGECDSTTVGRDEADVQLLSGGSGSKLPTARGREGETDHHTTTPTSSCQSEGGTHMVALEEC